MDKDKYLKELQKWVSSDSLLVIDKESNLMQIYCPFKVICLVTFPAITKGQKVSVDAIKLTVEIKEVYIIKNTPYHIAYFMITLEGWMDDGRFGRFRGVAVNVIPHFLLKIGLI